MAFLPPRLDDLLARLPLAQGEELVYRLHLHAMEMIEQSPRVRWLVRNCRGCANRDHSDLVVFRLPHADAELYELVWRC